MMSRGDDDHLGASAMVPPPCSPGSDGRSGGEIEARCSLPAQPYPLGIVEAGPGGEVRWSHSWRGDTSLLREGEVEPPLPRESVEHGTRGAKYVSK